MEETLNIKQVIDAIDFLMVWLFIFAGYVATDKLFLQDCVRFMKGRKSIAVFVAGLPIALVYLILNPHGWVTIILSYLVANILYDLAFKNLKKYLTK